MRTEISTRLRCEGSQGTANLATSRARMSQEEQSESQGKNSSEPKDEKELATESDTAVAAEPKQLMSRQLLSQNVEEMIADMNAKRRRDTALLEEFKEDMESRCRSAYQAVEAVLYNMYQKSSSNIDSKLQDLFATLERIDKIEGEMEQFRRQLGAFCTTV